jgi:hypothetical protein
MIPPWLVPSLSIALNLASAGVYAFHGDLKRTIYWLAAATLTACVTF